MRGLSIRQPYAHLMMAGFKPVTNRSWHTTYRGELLIHTGRRHATWEDEARVDIEVRFPQPYRSQVLRRADEQLVYSSLVGVAHLQKILKVGPMEARRLRGLAHLHRWHYEWIVGRYVWVFTRIRRFRRPVPFRRGNPTLFDVPRRKVRHELADAVPV